MTKNRELFTNSLVLQCSPSTSSHQPQATHVFADSRIALLYLALRYALHKYQQNFVPFPCLYIEFFELVIEVVLQSQISIDNLVLQFSFDAFR